MFEEFIRLGKVRKGDPDIALSKSLVKMSRLQLRYADCKPITGENASPTLVTYYEALREICEAICAKDGFKVYSHEAFTFFLKENLHEDRIAESFDRLRKLRNGVNYYGEGVNREEAKAASEEVKKIILELKQKYLSDLEQT